MIPAHGAGMQQVRSRTHDVVANLQPAGRLNASRHLQLAISLPLRNQQELTALLAQLQDPASPNYHQYLTPAQFTERFGPTAANYQALITFATAHGLTVTALHPNRVILDVDGAVQDIERALHVTMRTYQHPREPRQFYAPDADPTLDMAVPILGISGLDNYELPRPHLRINSINGKAIAGAGSITAALSGSAASASPESGSGPNGLYMGNDFRTAYASGVTLTGTGQSVGLLEFDGYTAGDIAYYENVAGLPAVPLTNVLLDGYGGAPTGDGGEVEVSLDIEVAISMAPAASGILVYEAGPYGNWHDILNRMADDNLAKQMSCSWYIPGGAADPVADQIFQQMAMQGQSFYAASGDSDAYPGLIPFPGDSPYITEVGGTELTESGAGGPYSSESVWNQGGNVGSGGGISTQYTIPTWQQGINMTANLGSTTMRNTPDVAMTAYEVYVRVDGENYNVGGTSCAAPLWAAFTALVNQQAVANGTPTAGFVNPAIYALCSGTGYAGAFHDITVGNNFNSSSPARFPAEPGYDLCTGWGTPNGNGLIYALAGPPTPIISTSGTLPVGVVGAAYSEDLAVTGGAAPYTWTLSGGSLPAGLSLSSSVGIISGTPTASGTATFSVQVTDTNGRFSTTPFSLTVYPQGTPLITTSSPLYSGTLGLPYYQVFAAAGGATPYTWSISSGSLPSSLALAGSGLLSGTPTMTGTFQFTVEVAGTDGLASTSPFVLLVPPPPAITSALSATGVTGKALTYQISATNKPTSYGASGLPAGLAVNPSTGLISGTPTSTGTTSVTISASSSWGTGSATLTITVLEGPPIITSALSVTGTSGQPFSYQITGLNSPTGFFAGGLNYPSGTVVSGSNLLVTMQSGDVIGEYNLATGAVINPNFITGLSGPANIALSGGNLFVNNQATSVVGEYNATTGAVVNASLITDAPSCNGLAISTSGTMYVSLDGYAGVGEYATNGSTLNEFFIQSLDEPAEVTLYGNSLFVAHDSGNAVGLYNATTGSMVNSIFITGVETPNGLAVSGSTLYVSCLGTNIIGEYNAVTGAAINANLITTGLVNPGYITVSGSDLFVSNSVSNGGWIAEYNATTGAPINLDFISGLPAGLSLNTATGVISGTPISSGATTVTISAANASGTGSATLTITVAQGPPVITSALSVTGTSGAPFNYQIAATNNPTSYAASGLPAGLSVNATTGVISGTTASTGTSTVLISASNTSGVGNASLVISIIQLPAPVITSAVTATGTNGFGLSYQITATNYPASYNASGLPAGLSVNTTTGLISGTPISFGTSSATISAGNASGTGTAAVTFTILQTPAPAITSAATITGTNGFPFTYQITATYNPTSFNATGLPPGLNVNTATGVISGTATSTGIANATIAASNAGGTGTAGLAITILQTPVPVINSAASITGTNGFPLAYNITATNFPTSFGATGLPSGLGINTATGVISGTPASIGTSIAAISASNPGGTGTASLTITVLPAPPVITSALNVTATSGEAFSYQITATNSPTSYSVTGLNYPSGTVISGSNLLVTSQNGDVVGAYNAVTGATVNTNFITGLNHPANIAISGSSLFIDNQWGNTVGEYNVATGAVINPSFISGASLCNGIAISTSGTIYVSLDGGDSVGEYGVNGTTINTSLITGLNGPGEVALSGSTLLVAHSSSSSIGEYNAATGAPINTNFITGLNVPNGLAVSGSTLYVTNLGNNTVGAYNAVTGATINANFITGLNNPGYISVSGSTLYVSNAVSTTGWVAEYNANTGAPINLDFIGGLPPGLSINTATGIISGTMASLGTSTITINAANSRGTGSGNLTITILPPVPVITSAPTATGTIGDLFNYQITANNNATSYGATGLPAGWNVNATTGIISGSASIIGMTGAIVSASNGYGTGYAPLTITIASTFSSWQNQWFTPAQLGDPTISGLNAMPAGDGISNLLKYAFNLNPFANGLGSLPAESTMAFGGTNYLTLTYTQSFLATDISYIPQISGDLTNWYSGPGYIVPVSTTPNDDGVTETVIVRDAAPIGTLPAFIRLEVTQP